MKMVCAVTGASGYLGSRLSAFLESQGAQVVRLGRGSEPPFSLESPLPGDFFGKLGVNSLVHCAYDFRWSEWNDIWAVNGEGSLRLLEQAHNAGIENILFISTMSAFPGCRSHYGRAKLLIEAKALELGGVVLRPGLIYGEEPGGMVGKLLRLVKLSPVLPLVGNGNQPLYAVHEEDLLRLCFTLLRDPRLGEGCPVIAAHPQRWTLRTILSAFAQPIRRKLFFLPIPWRFIWAVFRLAEKMSLPTSFRSDSVVSLVNQDQHPDFSRHSALRASFRPLLNRENR